MRVRLVSCLLFIAICALSFDSVQGSPLGASGCGSGEAAVAGAHTARNPQPGNGTLSDGDIKVNILDEVGTLMYTADPTTIGTLNPNTNYIIQIDTTIATNPMRGFLIRLGSNDFETLGMLEVPVDDDTAQIALPCTPLGVAGITHTSNSEKTVASGSLSIPSTSTVYVDVTVVARNCGPQSSTMVGACDPATSIYWWSSFTFDVVEEEEQDKPTSAPTLPTGEIGPLNPMSRLNEVPFVFSHNAATGYLVLNSPIEETLFGYSKNQNATFTEQLNCGVRAFDMRPKQIDNDIYFVHNTVDITEISFQEGIEEILAWAQLSGKNSNELIILKITNCDGCNENVQAILDGLGITFISDCGELATLTVGDALALSSTVLAIKGYEEVGDSCFEQNYDPDLTCHGFSEDSTSYSCWLEDSSSEIPIGAMSQYLEDVVSKGPNEKGRLTQLQGLWQTSGDSVALGIVLGSNIIRDSDESQINRLLLDFVKEKVKDNAVLNLVEVDSVCDAWGRQLLAALRPPILSPTAAPFTDAPSTEAPIPSPTDMPVVNITLAPTATPTQQPTPVTPDTSAPTALTIGPTDTPITNAPTAIPTQQPTPAIPDTSDPTALTLEPTNMPVVIPTVSPTPPLPSLVPATDLPTIEQTDTLLLASRQEMYSFPGAERYFPNVDVSLKQEENGSFVLYRGQLGLGTSNFLLFSSNYTGDNSNYYTRLQGDGNLVTRPGFPSKPRTNSVWSTKSSGEKGDYMFVLSADQEYLYIKRGTPDSPGSIVWSIRTNGEDHSCTANPVCRDLGLIGNCCPTNEGVYLSCCQETASPVSMPTEKPILPLSAIALLSSRENVLSSDVPRYYREADVYIDQKKNGRFVLYRGHPESEVVYKLWQSDYQGSKGEYYTRLQGNGELLTRPGSPDDEPKQKTVWKSRSGGESGIDYYLVLTGDQKLLSLRKGGLDGQIIWSETTKA